MCAPELTCLNVSKFRSLLVPLTAAWLSVHVLMMTGAVILAFSPGAVPEMVCTCVHGGDHESCPMHGTPKDSTRCRLQSTQGDPATLLGGLGPLVLPVPSNVTTVDASSPGPVGEVSPLPSDWIVPPEAPPPRS